MLDYYSTNVEPVLYQEKFDKPKFHVEYPELTATDRIACMEYARLNETELILDGHKALIIRNGVPGFIQKHHDRIFVSFKDGTWDDITKKMLLQKIFDVYHIFPADDPESDFTVNDLLRFTIKAVANQPEMLLPCKIEYHALQRLDKHRIHAIG